jgi:aerobic-type carbon monoxide dehydrogenase small subunit (CoxS/CutS family)
MTERSNTPNLQTRVNGEVRQHYVEPGLLLIEFLRDVLGLTGTHIACDTSQCGACTVLVDSRPVKSCTMLALQAFDRDVTTIEGLANGEDLHTVQRAFWENFALQCGYCTPGFIMSTVAMINEKTPLDETTIRERLAGNLCRCTGYVTIVKAAEAAIRAMTGGEVEGPVSPA